MKNKAVLFVLLSCVGCVYLTRTLVGYTGHIKVDQGNARGARAPRATVFEVSDYHCHFSAKFHPMVKEAVQAMPDVRFVYMHSTLRLPGGTLPAEATECAADQDLFWPLSDFLFEHVEDWKPIPPKGPERMKRFTQYAVSLGANVDQFQKCLESGVKIAKIRQDEYVVKRLGVGETPYFLVDGVKIADKSVDGIRRAIESVTGENTR